jgi:hypothetical protein
MVDGSAAAIRRFGNPADLIRSFSVNVKKIRINSVKEIPDAVGCNMPNEAHWMVAMTLTIINLKRGDSYDHHQFLTEI